MWGKFLLIVFIIFLPVLTYAGVTIHYSGEIDSIDNIEKILNISAKYAQDNKWKIVQAENGYTFYPADWCEPLTLKFNGKQLTDDFVKTQFAGVEVHIKIVDLFVLIKPYMKELSILDEGEYWDTKSKEKLELNFDSVNSTLMNIKSERPNVIGPTKLSDGRIVDLHT